MTRLARLLPTLFSLLAALLLMPAPARAAEPAALTPAEQTEFENAVKFMERIYGAPKPNRFDSELGPQVQALLADYRARFPALIRGWLIDLRTEQLAERPRRMAMYTRLVTAMTVSRMEPIDAEDDRRWLAAVSQPASCLPRGEYSGTLTLAYLQAVPKAERAAALQAERLRLERFGEVPKNELHAPTRNWLEDARKAVQAIQALGVDQAPPLPPALSDLWLSADFQPPRNGSERCAAVQWWSKLPRTGAPPAERLALMRYTLAPQGLDFARHPEGADKAEKTDAYSDEARYWHAEGMVELELLLDAEGKVIRAGVLRRQVAIPGLGRQPALAFETLLDDMARQQAGKSSYPDWKPSKPSKDGTWKAVQQYHYKLD